MRGYCKKACFQATLTLIGVFNDILSFVSPSVFFIESIRVLGNDFIYDEVCYCGRL